MSFLTIFFRLRYLLHIGKTVLSCRHTSCSISVSFSFVMSSNSHVFSHETCDFIDFPVDLWTTFKLGSFSDDLCLGYTVDTNELQVKKSSFVGKCQGRRRRKKYSNKPLKIWILWNVKVYGLWRKTRILPDAFPVEFSYINFKWLPLCVFRAIVFVSLFSKCSVTSHE